MAMQPIIFRKNRPGLVTFCIPYTVVLLWATLFCGCGKNDSPPMETKLHGHLIVRGTGEIINDRPYKIGLRHISGSEVSTLTDQNGHFKLSHQSESGTYQLIFLDDIPDSTFWEDGAWMELDSNDFSGNVVSFGSGYRGNVDMAVTKKAWVELHVENMTPQIGDRIRINFRGWEHVFHHGQNFKVILPGSGNIPNRLHFWVIKPGVDSQRQTEWIQLGEMDTTYFKLEY